MSLPFQITLIPNYITMMNLHFVDTFFALIIPFSVSAFAILNVQAGIPGFATGID